MAHPLSYLLGRKGDVPPDPRNWTVEQLRAERHAPEREITSNDLLKEILVVVKAILAFLQAAFGGDTPTPPPPPPPTPPTPTPPMAAVLWDDAHPGLDQGQTGHCVGFAAANWGNTLPVGDSYTDADGHAIYYECKVLDGEPKQEDGSTTLSGMKALQKRGRVKAYAEARTRAEVNDWLLHDGPLTTGTDWLNNMFDVDAHGYVTVSGPVEGGHDWLLVGYDPVADEYVAQNSWGASWGATIGGVPGRFRIRGADYQKLLNGVQYPGDAFMALEQPLGG